MLEPWTTAMPDWEVRIVAGQSLIPHIPLDEARSAKALRIFKRLKMVDVLGKPTMGQACDPWVFDFVRVIFGARDAETKRQFLREFFLLISKKNGKSSIAAGIMLTALILNERAMGEYLILAPTKDIADNSFVPAYGMVKEDKALFARYKPSDSTREIVDRLDGSTLAVKSADADVIGGQKAISVFVDELWLFGKKAAAANILSEAVGSQVSRPEGFVIYASTQSDQRPAGVFKTKLDYARGVRDGTIADKTFLPLIYEYPAEMVKAKAWNDPGTWRITNPSMDRSVDPEWLATQLAQKANNPEELNLFVAKHFNVQVGVGILGDAWAGAQFWGSRANPAITLETILERCEVVVVGLDGGGLDDLYGLNVLGREWTEVEVDEEETLEDGTKVKRKKAVKRWLSWSHAWCHKGVLERRKSIATVLEGFAKAEELTIVDDTLDDIADMIAIIQKIKDAGLLHCVAVDPAGLGEMIDELAGIDVTQDNKEQGSNFVIGAPQGFAMMNAIKTAERKLANKTLLHADQGLMDWAVGNVKIEPLATAIRATKQNAGDAKIDPWAALMNAVTVMSTNPEAAISVFDRLGDDDGAAQSDDDSAQDDDIDEAILANPRHPRWQEMRERWEEKHLSREEAF